MTQDKIIAIIIYRRNRTTVFAIKTRRMSLKKSLAGIKQKLSLYNKIQASWIYKIVLILIYFSTNFRFFFLTAQKRN